MEVTQEQLYRLVQSLTKDEKRFINQYMPLWTDTKAKTTRLIYLLELFSVRQPETINKKEIAELWDILLNGLSLYENKQDTELEYYLQQADLYQLVKYGLGEMAVNQAKKTVKETEDESEFIFAHIAQRHISTLAANGIYPAMCTAEELNESYLKQLELLDRAIMKAD